MKVAPSPYTFALFSQATGLLHHFMLSMIIINLLFNLRGGQSVSGMFETQLSFHLNVFAWSMFIPMSEGKVNLQKK